MLGRRGFVLGGVYAVAGAGDARAQSYRPPVSDLLWRWPYRDPPPLPEDIDSVHFEPGSAKLDEAALTILGRQYLALRKHQFGWLRIFSFLDPSEVSGPDAGRVLARQRADAVLAVYVGFGWSKKAMLTQLPGDPAPRFAPEWLARMNQTTRTVRLQVPLLRY